MDSETEGCRAIARISELNEGDNGVGEVEGGKKRMQKMHLLRKRVEIDSTH